MAESSGVSEAGKAWIVISVKDEFTEGLEQASRALEGFSDTAKKSTGDYNQALEEASRSSEERWKSIADSCTQAGELLTGAWRKLSVPAREAVDVYSDFDDMIRAASAKMAGATDEELRGLYNQAKKLGAALSFTATDVAEGMKLLAQNGFGASEVRDSIRPVMDLARATGTDVATAAEIASTTLRSFNMEAGQMEHVCDVLTATANTSAQGLVDIGYAISFSATNAATAGSSLEDYLELLGILANYGLKGSKGGTAMRQMLTATLAPKKQEILSMMGVKVKDENGDMRSIKAIIDDVKASVQDKGNGYQLEAFYDAFGVRGMASAANISKGSFDALSSAIHDAEGVARKTSDAMDAGLGGSIRMMKSAAETLQITFGEALAPALSSCFDSFKHFFAGTAEWIAANKDLVAGITEVGAAVSALGGALLVAGGAASVFSKACGVAGTAVGVLGKAFLFLEANPIVALLTGVAIAAGAIGMKMYLAHRETMKYGGAAAKLRQENEARAETDREHMARLAELAEKEQLNNHEVAEAARLVQVLNGHYRDLGLTFDSTTGKIEGLTEAQQKLAKAQLDQSIRDKKAELAEKQKQYSDKYSPEQRTKYGFVRPEIKEYTKEELDDLDAKGVRVASAGGGQDLWAMAPNWERAVFNEQSGKYHVASQRNGIFKGKESADEARQRVEKALAQQNLEAAQIAALSEEIETLEGQRTEMTAEPRPIEGASPDTAAESETKNEPGEESADTDREPAKLQLAGDVWPWRLRKPRKAAAAPQTEDAIPAELLPQSGIAPLTLFTTMGLNPSELEALEKNGWDADLARADLAQAEEAAAEKKAGKDNSTRVTNRDLAGQLQSLGQSMEQLTRLQNELIAFRQSEEQQAQEQGEQMQQSVADWKNGPGSASYQRMDVTDKAIVETAENTKITADYVKKLYDLLKAGGGQAVFAQ